MLVGNSTDGKTAERVDTRRALDKKEEYTQVGFSLASQQRAGQCSVVVGTNEVRGQAENTPGQDRTGDLQRVRLTS